LAVNSDPVERPDAELIGRIAQGDRQAFELLYDRHSSVIYSLVVKIVRDATEAEDVLQDAFIQIWDKAASFDLALGKPLSWMIAVARNKALDRLRGIQRRQQFLTAALDSPEGEVSQEKGCFVARELGGLVRAALQKLPMEQRRAIEMAFFSGFSQSEIAQALKQPLGTVKARIRRGMLKLSAELKQYL
jgi:RNA polymerase sigma-70 factor, ECF subfamily